MFTFLDLLYGNGSGKEKNPLEVNIEIVADIITKIKPHQVLQREI
jgi:hypothetical protein